MTLMNTAARPVAFVAGANRRAGLGHGRGHTRTRTRTKASVMGATR
jgi:hypothetical protein